MSDEPTFLACGDYTPDLGDYGNPGSTNVQNAIPRAPNTYSPLPSFSTQATTALNSAPLGAYSIVSSEGDPGNYVGTASKLYVMTNSSKPNFLDATRTSGAYSVGSDGYWSYAEANGNVYATNGTDPVQYIENSTPGNFANHPDTNCPTGKLIAFIQPGFLLLGNIVDPTVGAQPQGVRWSSLGDPTTFPLIGSSTAIANNSDWQQIAGDHGRMMGIATNLSSCNAAIFFEQAIFKMIFTGTETIFAFTPVEQARGARSGRSIAQLGQICYFLGWDDFFVFDGTEAIPIGNAKVKNAFFADADPNYLDQVTAAVDQTSGLIFWSYAGVGNSNGVPNRILVYNPYIQRFAWITQTAGNNLFIARSLGTTLDNIDALGYNLDNLPYSLDSQFLAGGNIVLGGFDTSFKYGSFTGPNMPFTIDTREAQLTPGRKTQVQFIVPITEGDTCSVALLGRDTTSGTPIVGPTITPNSDGRCPVRGENKFHRVRLLGAAGNLCSLIKGAEVYGIPGAIR